MDIIIERGCGLDTHKKTITACIMGTGIKKEIRTAGLDEYTEYAGFLPYKELLTELINAKYLLVCASEPRHVPGKLFE